MSNKFIILAFLFINLFYADKDAISQTHELNHRKYWYYRFRVLNDFIKHGIGQGESLIASQHGIGSDRNVLKFGDQTANLGLYLGVLATEYHLLATNNQNTDQVVKEIYYVLSAVNRLDLNAESRYRPGGNYQTVPVAMPGDLNGFFCRDDVLKSFVTTDTTTENWIHFNSNKLIRKSELLEGTDSDWSNQDPNNQYPGEMSKDQVIFLMVGFALLEKFVPESVTYVSSSGTEAFIDGETSLNREGGNILRRIIMHINGKSQFRVNWLWIIRNYVTDNNVNFGPAMTAEAYPAALAACYMYPNHCLDFQNSWSASPLAALTWRFVWLGSTIGTSSQVNAAMWATLKALSNDFFPSTTVLSDLTFYSLITSRNLRWTALLRQILHGGPNLISDDYYEDVLLNTAPCEGPYKFTSPSCEYGAYEWSTSDRLLHPQRRGDCSDVFTGEYPGFDYMLLHNMYYIVQSQYYQNPVNLMYTTVSVDYPLTNPSTGITVGVPSNPAQVNMFSSIDARNTINPTSATGEPNDVTYRAGDEVHLHPGFHVTASSGSHFRAYVDPFECAEDGTYRQPEQGPANNNYLAAKNDHVFGNESGFTLHEVISPVADYHYYFDERDPQPETETAAMDAENVQFLNIWPNPASESFTVALPDDMQGFPLAAEIYNINGQRMAAFGFQEQGTHSFNCANWASGLYVIRMYVPEMPEICFTQKLLVQH